MQYEGFVNKVLSRPFGNKTMYSLTLVNQDGFFGFGGDKPKANQGDKVSFEAETNAKGYLQAKGYSLRVLAPAAESVSTAPTARQATGGNGQSAYWDRKEARDLKQDELREIGATRNTAIEWIKLLLDKEAIKLPTKIADKEAFLQELLRDTVDKLRHGPKGSPDRAPEAVTAVGITENTDEVIWE